MKVKIKDLKQIVDRYGPEAEVLFRGGKIIVQEHVEVEEPEKPSPANNR